MQNNPTHIECHPRWYNACQNFLYLITHVLKHTTIKYFRAEARVCAERFFLVLKKSVYEQINKPQVVAAKAYGHSLIGDYSS